MKKIKLFLLSLLIPAFSFAQGGIEIVPFAGYMFGGSINFYEGKLKITDGVDYGVSLVIPIRDVVDIEISYTGMQSEAKFTAYAGYPGFSDEQTGVNTSYFQIGTIKKIPVNNPDIIPFGSFTLGATLFALDAYTDTWRFSITAGGGVKFMFSDHVGVILRGRLMLPMSFGGVGGYCGIGTGGSGCGLSLNSYATLVQGDFNGGLVFKFGN